MDDFDALPKPMRELLAHAPFNYCAIGAARNVANLGLETAIEQSRKIMADHIQAMAAHDYSATHPQAQTERSD